MVLAARLLCFLAAGIVASAAHAYDWRLPPWLPPPDVPEDNPMSAAKVELGRRLFYDKRLSATGDFACASCHQQARAFTDGRRTATGATGERHPRSSMNLTNVAYATVLTWASAKPARLESQMLTPFFGGDPVEMGSREDVLLATLRGDAAYRRLFADSFPGAGEAISVDTATKALAAFERTLISANAPYDRYRRGGEADAISAAAKRGEALFFGRRAGCGNCHHGPNFSDAMWPAGRSFDIVAFHNTGLYNVAGTGAYPPANVGLVRESGQARDMGRFKTPTLRNVARTAPYMHDGSIATLEEVIDHYAAGGRTIADGPHAGVGAASPFKSPQILGFAITEDEKADLVEFLRSLTDEDFLRDPRFADPFVSP